MEFATGALGTLLPKLAQLLQDEYKLLKNVRKNIEFLSKELEITQAALRIVGEVPTEQLTELVRIWARDARELSYDMEDVVDTFLVCVQGLDPRSKRISKRIIQRMKSLLTVGKRHEIGEQIKDIKERVERLAARRDRYKVETINHETSVDPRIKALYAKTTELVGVDESKEELILKLTKGDDMSTQLQKIVSIVGFGGLGKTTLAKAVYDEIKLQFDCSAFVTVSRNPDMTKFLKDMLYKLDKQKYENIHSTSRDVTQLIELVLVFISNKRYLIIIDDIWDILNWENTIKLALPDKNLGSRIITTTRNLTVAKHIGGVYEMKPLSSDSSRLLLYTRMFGNEGPEKCLEEDLAKISDKILKKCAGVPLATITIAGLLTSRGRNQMELYDEVYKSIGTGMENSLDAKNMREILSYSYYDLPSHLKTCLLYLSMFPEDFEIEKERLIWLWRAEGFIQHNEHGKSQFEIGESYFNELINRSLIQPIRPGLSPMIHACRVHDTVLDLLCSLSREQNFISILSDESHTSTAARSHRLSIQVQGIPLSLPKLRSAVFFSSVPNALRFNVLRVLDLQDGNLGQGYDLKYLTKLFHLRYLGLGGTKINELPEEVVELKFLETLDIWGTRISCLPSTIVKLRKLMSISVSAETSVPNGIGCLGSLEHLSCLRIDDESIDHIEGLGILTELRVLRLALFTNKWNEKLVGSLLKLRKIKCLEINCYSRDDQRNIGGLDTWVAPRRLCSLQTTGICWFSRLPAWMNNPRHLTNLYNLSIAIKEMQQKDLDILGRLPTLCKLRLELDHKDLRNHRGFVVGADLFSRLEYFGLRGFAGPLVFHQGAMPRLTDLYFHFHVRAVREIAGNGGGLDLGLGNLLSLQYVIITFRGSTIKEDFEEAEAALKQATEIHPNRPLCFDSCIDTGTGFMVFDKYQTPETTQPEIGHDNAE